MKITNNQPGPRGVNTVNGPVLLEAKETRDDLKVYAREQAHIDASGWFTVEGDYEANPAETGAPAAPAGDANEVATLKARIADLEAENAKLKKGDNGTDVTTVAEALALFSTDGVHANTAKAGAKKFLGDKVKADASKDDILAALLKDASDTEIKTFLGAKGVEVKDETRDDLIKLAQAA